MAFESVKKIAEADFPTRWGAFRILGFEGQPVDPPAKRHPQAAKLNPKVS
jgi:GTP cyclohydrolase II